MTQTPASLCKITLRIPSDLKAADLLLEMKHISLAGIEVVEMDWPTPEKA
jgi:hypothetical protein